MEKSLYKRPTHTDQFLQYSSHHQTSCKESAASSLFNRAYSNITNRDDVTTKIRRINKCQTRIDIKKALLVKSSRELLNMKLTIVTAKQFFSVNIRFQMNTKNLSGAAIVI